MSLPSIFEYLPDEADTILKLAAPTVAAPAPRPASVPQQGHYQKYLPWYASAGLGMAGHELGKLAPEKYQLLGRLGGTLVGTALGVHGGEYVGRKLDKRLSKSAEAPLEPPQDQLEHPIRHGAKAVLGGLGAFGVGTLAGYGAGVGVEKLLGQAGRRLPSKALRIAIPAAGGAMGLAYQQYKHHEAKELKRALESHRNKSKGRTGQ